MGAGKKWQVVLALCAAGFAGAWGISAWPGGAQPACRGGRGLSLAEFHEQTAMAPEDVMYRQPYAVERALESLAPQRPGKTDLYYVGFAGDGKEDVFTNDVQLAQKALAPYGAAGHTLLLQNHVESVYDTPIADAANLEAALQGLARRMDTREDVLFLFLSSHGAYDHELSVDFPPLQLRDLSAEHLKAMLDKSGIRYRVIVVSACYSGGFLDVLKDDNTLVLTASSRDHEAYGCGDVTKYTEFTAAYFGQALQQGASFIDAFASARNTIAEGEKRNGWSPSQPQIYIGRNVAQVLQKLEIAPVTAARQEPAAQAGANQPGATRPGATRPGANHPGGMR